MVKVLIKRGINKLGKQDRGEREITLHNHYTRNGLVLNELQTVTSRTGCLHYSLVPGYTQPCCQKIL